MSILNEIERRLNEQPDVEEGEQFTGDGKGYTVSMTFSTIKGDRDPEEEVADYDERGYEEEDVPYDNLLDVVNAYDTKASWVEWSSSPSIDPTHDWITSEGYQDVRSGDETVNDLFVRRIDGEPMTQEEIDYLHKGLTIPGNPPRVR